jgi:peptidyl-prolyl cis-trans isomerase A (cyclophilin A)
MTRARRPVAALLAVAAIFAIAAAAERPQGWYAVVETTLGTFTFRLVPEQSPQSVAHFVAFAEGKMEYVDPYTGNKKKAPFYDGIAVHKTEFAQRFEAGDPTGTGHGMPPVWVPPEFGPVNFTRPYRVGLTSASMKRISGVMFFVSIVAEPYLNASHNCIGEVVEGRDVVERICNVKTDPMGKPIEPVVLKHVTIVKVGNPPPIPDPVPYTPPVPVFGLDPGSKPPS